ncbi:hypothetical protein [Spirillospora sp. NPDC047279]|uniref:hypothetical protein n=1 Tax=Spirillospora sp. NPDC047279 TaxID=3155478 RepID=UPI003409BB4D
MSTRGWPDSGSRPWPEIASSFQELADADPAFGPLAAIAESVITCRADEHLAATTSMHDLVVTAAPVPAETPVDVVIVRSPSSGLANPGWVLIEHCSTTGHDARIARPAGAAVPLFWRFMLEKFGIGPARA